MTNASPPTEGMPAEELRKVCKGFLVGGYHGDYLEDDGYELAREVERLTIARLAHEPSDRIWREMLAHAYSGSNLYRDDGELVDGSDIPVLDYLRMPPEQLRIGIHERGRRKLEAAIQKHGSLEAAMAASKQPHEPGAEQLRADLAFAYQCLQPQYHEGPECDCEYGHQCGWPKFRDFMERIAPMKPDGA